MNVIKRGEYYPSWTRFFDELFNRDMFDWNSRNFSKTNTTLPAVNVQEDADGYKVEMAAPGMSKKDFRIG